MTGRFDTAIIGGGHNGLVCAAYLARAGQKVLVLEAADRVGGAASTRGFAPGFKVSACAHLLHLMSRALIAELELERHGLVLAGRALPTTVLAEGGGGTRIGDPAALAADAAAYGPFAGRLGRLAARLRPLLEMVPPRLGGGEWRDRIGLLRLGWQIRGLGRDDMRELLRIVGMNVHDLLDEHFAGDAIKGAIGFDAVLGTAYGPRSPGTVLTLLYRHAAESAAGGAGLAQPLGGMGALAAALAAAATAAGATIRTEAPVARILVEGDRATGVRLASGETIAAAAVVSNADPKATFLDLLGAEHLDTGFVRRIRNLRMRGMAAKLHLALDALPSFGGLPPEALAGRLLIAPSLDYLERAYNASKYDEASAAPAMEITLPTVADPGLAPDGRHVLSAIVQYAPYGLAGGWDGQREAFAYRTIDVIERHAPGLKRSIRAVELLAPPDIEREFRIGGGHWHHGELAFDQFFMIRPVPGATQYRTPVEGLYLCGAGCHPGGGVMGSAGRNAARQLLRKAA